MKKSFSQGKQVNEQEHLRLLEKMNAFQQQKKVTYVKNATVEQVLKELESCDEVVVKLKDSSILRVKENTVFINGVLADHVEPTSDIKEQMFIPNYEEKRLIDGEMKKVTVYTNIPISNSFTGEQRFKQILQKYLD